MKSLSNRFSKYCFLSSTLRESEAARVAESKRGSKIHARRAPRVQQRVPLSYTLARESDAITINCPSAVVSDGLLIMKRPLMMFCWGQLFWLFWPKISIHSSEVLSILDTLVFYCLARAPGHQVELKWCGSVFTLSLWVARSRKCIIFNQGQPPSSLLLYYLYQQALTKSWPAADDELKTGSISTITEKRLRVRKDGDPVWRLSSFSLRSALQRDVHPPSKRPFDARHQPWLIGSKKEI